MIHTVEPDLAEEEAAATAAAAKTDKEDEKDQEAAAARRVLAEGGDGEGVGSGDAWAEAQEQKGKFTKAQENEGGFRLGAVAVLFSVENYDKSMTPEQQATFDTFFDDLIAVQGSNSEAEKLSLAATMEALDWGNRYVYKGSMTTPPCEQFVYWNVVRRVYPIKQEHVNWFRAQRSARGAGEENWREVQTGFNADVLYVQSGAA